jgi:hypothetical protein
MDHRQQGHRWSDQRNLPSARRHRLLAIEFPRLADPAGHSPQEDVMSATVTQEWLQACDRMLSQWRDDVARSERDLIELGQQVATMSPDRQHVTQLLVAEDVALLHVIYNLKCRLEKWDRYEADHGASREQGRLSTHLAADRELADALCDVIDVIRLGRQIGGAA